MEFLVVLAILLIVASVVSAPIRREWAGPRQRHDQPQTELERELAELEAARDAKSREIRDAELDRRTGKLSEEDFEAVDRALRADAIEILRELDQAKGRLTATIAER